MRAKRGVIPYQYNQMAPGGGALLGSFRDLISWPERKKGPCQPD